MAWKGIFNWQSSAPRNEGVRSASQAERSTEPHQLMQLHRQRLATLRLESGYSPEIFEHLIGALARAVAEYVHVLPASRAENHTEPGGLMRFSLEAACSAYRHADGQFLSGPCSTDVRNRELDRAWRYATFVGALLRPLGRALTDVRVVAAKESSEVVWNPYQEPLWVWVRRVDAVQLDIQWQRNDDRPVRPASIWLAARLLTPAALTYLHQAEGLLQTLLRMLAGESVGRIGELVEQACKSTVDDELARIGQRHDLAVTGLRIEHRLLEVIRALVREKWTLNSPGGRIWYTHEGVFLSWRAAVNDLTVRLRAEGINNVPRDADTIAEVLTQHGVLKPNPTAVNGLRHYYRITPQLRGSPKQTIEAVKIADVELIGLHLEGVDAIEAHAPLAVGEVGTSKTSKKKDLLSLELPLHVQTSRPAPNKRGGPPPVENATESSPAPQLPEQPEPTQSGDVIVESTPQDCPEKGMPISERKTSPSTCITKKDSANLDRLNRYGEAGQVLRALAERLLAEPAFTRLVPLEEGVALAYPQAIVPFCSQPQTFLAACEAQGLLVGGGPGGRRMLRTRMPDETTLPEQYVVLSARVSQCLPIGSA